MTNITQFPIPALQISQINPLPLAALTDIIVADQSGVTGTETLQQVYNLFLPSLFLGYAGNPNGNVAGNVYQTCYDTVDNILYICTSTGTATSAVWQTDDKLDISWNDVTIGTANMVPNNGYVADGSGTTTLILPINCPFGSRFYIAGRLNGWTIQQNANQQIFVSPSSTTVGTGGSLASTHAQDSLTLLCTKANREFTAISVTSQGLTIV